MTEQIHPRAAWLGRSVSVALTFLVIAGAFAYAAS
jgi:hypothetical protein